MPRVKATRNTSSAANRRGKKHTYRKTSGPMPLKALRKFWGKV